MTSSVTIKRLATGVPGLDVLLRHSLGLTNEASAIEIAVHDTIAAGRLTADCVAPGQRACSTSDFGDAVVERLSVLTVSA